MHPSAALRAVGSEAGICVRAGVLLDADLSSIVHASALRLV